MNLDCQRWTMKCISSSSILPSGSNLVISTKASERMRAATGRRPTRNSARFLRELRAVMAGLSAQLRRTTLDAPLRSLFLAFILEVWVARRR